MRKLNPLGWKKLNEINQKYKISEFDITDYDEIDHIWCIVRDMFHDTDLVDEEDLSWLEKVCEIEY